MTFIKCISSEIAPSLARVSDFWTGCEPSSISEGFGVIGGESVKKPNSDPIYLPMLSRGFGQTSYSQLWYVFLLGSQITERRVSFGRRPVMKRKRNPCCTASVKPRQLNSVLARVQIADPKWPVRARV